MSTPDIKSIGQQARKKQFQTLLKKISEGKTLSSSEDKIFRQLEEELEGESVQVDSSAGLGRWIMPADQVCEFFGVANKTLTMWTKQGMPKHRHGRYHLLDCHKWWLENIYKGDEDKDSTVTDAKRRYWIAKSEAEEIYIAKEKEKLVSREDVISDWSERAGELRTTLLNLGARLCVRLEQKPKVEVKKTLDEEMRQALETFCREGRYTLGNNKRKN